MPAHSDAAVSIAITSASHKSAGCAEQLPFPVHTGGIQENFGGVLAAHHCGHGMGGELNPAAGIADATDAAGGEWKGHLPQHGTQEMCSQNMWPRHGARRCGQCCSRWDKMEGNPSVASLWLPASSDWC